MSPKLLPYDMIKDIILWHQDYIIKSGLQASTINRRTHYNLQSRVNFLFMLVGNSRTFWRTFCKCKISCFLSNQL